MNISGIACSASHLIQAVMPNGSLANNVEFLVNQHLVWLVINHGFTPQGVACKELMPFKAAS
jgi:hypothetical protein